MAKAKKQELKALSDAELAAMCDDLRKEVFQMKCGKALQKEGVKAHELKEKRKNIARILTIQSERRHQR